MIGRSADLGRKPAIFTTTTGLTVALFADLVGALRPALAAARYATRERPRRQRAGGGGRRGAWPEREDILLTGRWLRPAFPQEALGYVCGVSDSTAKRTMARVRPVREAAGRDTLRPPPPSRRQRSGVAAARRAAPELARLDDASGVGDSYEQRVQRPRNHQEADRDDAGQTKAPTVKTPVVVALGTGRGRAVTPGGPGPVGDPTLWRPAGVLARVASDDPLLGAHA